MQSGGDGRGKLLRPGPQGRIEAALAGEGRDDPTRCAVGQQSQGAIEAGLACAVCTGDDVEPVQRETQVA